MQNTNSKSASKQLEDNLKTLETLTTRAYEYCKLKERNESAEHTAIDDALAFAANRDIPYADVATAFYCSGYPDKQSKIIANKMVEAVPLPPATPHPRHVDAMAILTAALDKSPPPNPNPEKITLDKTRYEIPNRFTRSSKYPIKEMEVDDSFTFHVSKIKSVTSSVAKRRKRDGTQYSIYRVSATEARCWRIA